MGYDPGSQTTVITWATTAATPDGRAPANEIARILIGELSKAAEVPEKCKP
jgi:D-alanyl-D-alanine carboxypeptidase